MLYKTNREMLESLSVEDIILEVLPPDYYNCPLRYLAPDREGTDKCTECRECISEWLKEDVI